jgi:hypothetical protein
VFLDKSTKGGWVLLARQHGVQLADLTPLQPLFERLERPPLALTHSWPTLQADEAVVQVRAWCRAGCAVWGWRRVWLWVMRCGAAACAYLLVCMAGLRRWS